MAIHVTYKGKPVSLAKAIGIIGSRTAVSCLEVWMWISLGQAVALTHPYTFYLVAALGLRIASEW